MMLVHLFVDWPQNLANCMIDVLEKKVHYISDVKHWRYVNAAHL